MSPHLIDTRLPGKLIGKRILDCCEANGIICDIEMRDIKNIGGTCEQVRKGGVRYRSIIERATPAEV